MVKKLTDDPGWQKLREKSHQLLDLQLDHMETLYVLSQVGNWWQRFRARWRLEALLRKVSTE